MKKALALVFGLLMVGCAHQNSEMPTETPMDDMEMGMDESAEMPTMDETAPTE